MSKSDNWSRSWGLFFARISLGLIFGMAGIYKVFSMGALNHARRLFVEPYADTFLPAWSLWATGTAIPVVELIAGGLLVLGLRVRESLIALGLVLAVVTFGHLLKQPFYELNTHVAPRLALVLLLLLLPRVEDRFCLDRLLTRLRRAG